jgi:AraC-like DNA-binding protein
MLTVHQLPPDERLRTCVHLYVQREAHLQGAELVEPVVARLGSILEFQFADPFNVPYYGIDTPNISPLIAVIGPITERRARIVIRGHVQALSVLFQPLGLHTLFGVPISPLANFGFEGHGVLGGTVSELYERLGNAKSFPERKHLLDRFFLKRLIHSRPKDAVTTALTLLMSADERLRVSDVARRVGLCSRQLERLSSQYVGMPPQMFMRIARFQKAIRMKLEGSKPWTEVAYAAEYDDQMHMIRDFRAFAGNSPVRALQQIEPEHLSRLGL